MAANNHEQIYFFFFWTEMNTNGERRWGKTQQLKQKNLMDKNLIKLTKPTDLRLKKAIGKGKYFCGAFSGL